MSKPVAARSVGLDVHTPLYDGSPRDARCRRQTIGAGVSTTHAMLFLLALVVLAIGGCNPGAAEAKRLRGD